MRILRGGQPAKLAAAALLTLSVAGCAGYSEQTAGVMTASRAGNVDQALATLESKNTSKDKDLLYYFEKGELLRQKGSYDDSRASWLMADEKVRGWEDDVRTDPSKLLGDIGSVLLNDTTRRYDGRDYEKVFLSVRIAGDHISVGDWDSARTEIKKMHEREAIIAEYRSKEMDAATSAADAKGIKAKSYKDLNGYPIETLDDPAVRALKNSYESAFANYLAGFVYEVLGEPGLAAPGYRKAAEMRPNVPLVDDGLKSLDRRMSTRGKTGTVDTLIVIEAGTAPAIQSVTLPMMLPIPSKRGMNVIATPLSWPVIRPDPTAIAPAAVTIDDRTVPAILLTDVNVMARRALSDEMPGIITRSAVRAISRAVAQVAIDQSTEGSKGNAQLAGAVFSLITKVAAVATEVADERIWRTLPGTYSVARVSLPAGTHKIALPTGAGVQMREVQVGGQYAVVALRVIGNNLYVAQSPISAQQLAPAVVMPEGKGPLIGGSGKPSIEQIAPKKAHAKKAAKKGDKATDIKDAVPVAATPKG
jgi:hypothetical protein